MKSRVSVFWPIVASLFFVLFVTVLSLDLWGLKPWGGSIDYQKAGTWGDLIAGIGTTLAALVAYWAILLESQRARAAETALAQRLNTQLFCWLEPRATEVGREWLLCFQNDIGVPIQPWLVSLVGQDKTLSSKDLGPVRPRSSQLRIEALTGLAHVSVPGVRLTFIDPAGGCWTRTEEGKLVEDSSDRLSESELSRTRSNN